MGEHMGGSHHIVCLIVLTLGLALPSITLIVIIVPFSSTSPVWNNLETKIQRIFRLKGPLTLPDRLQITKEHMATPIIRDKAIDALLKKINVNTEAYFTYNPNFLQ
nr:hypothetical protein HmN_000058400 [Hymenolepis microstoma]